MTDEDTASPLALQQAIETAEDDGSGLWLNLDSRARETRTRETSRS
jgi:hypothetical protein